MEKTDHMKDALSARRGKGLEVIIGLGRPGAEGDVGSHDGISGTRDGESNFDSKRSDLAPSPVSKEEKEAVMNSASGLHAPHPSGVIQSQQEMAPGDVPTPDDARAHFSENMSENDIRDMADRKPRSLAERARKEAFMQKKQ